MNSIKQTLASLRPRKVQGYCLGAAKTGTTSLSHMMTPHLRAAHEPETPSTTLLVMDYLEGKISDSACINAIRKRDRQLNLEFESSHPLGYLASQLVALYPHAKFIITVRDPDSWLASRISFHANRQPTEWQPYRDFIWQRHHQGFSKHELTLEQHSLYSLDAYLAQYSEQYRILFESIPPSQQLVIRTEDISHKLAEISQFLGLKEALQPIHTNQMTKADSILSRLDPNFVSDKLQQHCGWLMDAYWKTDKETA
ncbi:sulfotransferase [Parasalinivibrio latis]|uniref:sulfotransferase n=1 Tax=Parasalinivibrio latis TaxID=2952610 RepID=UPI0030DE9839